MDIAEITLGHTELSTITKLLNASVKLNYQALFILSVHRKAEKHQKTPESTKNTKK
jgi:hypothetical protein